MQATFGTLVGYLGVTERTALRASCPLEGGGASEGSTCGVVSGGCLGIVLAHLADILSGEAGKAEDLYGRLLEYTSWFEGEFTSTLCRERSGLDIRKVSSVLDYLFKSKAVSGCIDHIGKSAYHLLGLLNRPLDGGGEVTELDRKLAGSGGYCSAEVLRGIREDNGHGSLYLEQLSVAFDGGIGLSGGLCGALAGALLPMGLIWGIDPKKEGFIGSLIPFMKGHFNLYFHRREAELWALADLLMREFKERFGSFECRDIIGRSFRTGTELSEYMAGSTACSAIKEWCRGRASALISIYTAFS